MTSSLHLLPQDLNTHAADIDSLSSMSMNQQQQPFTQLYPQVHISHYPNFVPYRPLFSPLYASQMLVPDYSDNSAHIQPSAGSNYLTMLDGDQHFVSGSMKYGASQYKTVQVGNSTTGYGNYANPGGYMVSTFGSTTGMGDATRISLKDNSVYVPSPQVLAIFFEFLVKSLYLQYLSLIK